MAEHDGREEAERRLRELENRARGRGLGPRLGKQIVVGLIVLVTVGINVWIWYAPDPPQPARKASSFHGLEGLTPPSFTASVTAQCEKYDLALSNAQTYVVLECDGPNAPLAPQALCVLGRDLAEGKLSVRQFHISTGATREGKLQTARLIFDAINDTLYVESPSLGGGPGDKGGRLIPSGGRERLLGCARGEGLAQ